jgi:hypothetical protein
MSQYSGDMARYNRLRKARARKRAQIRVLRAELTAKPASTAEAKPKKSA